MSQTVTCECGKANRVDAGYGVDEVYCIRCGREIALAAAPSARRPPDPYGLVELPPDPSELPPRHPAGPAEAADPLPRPHHPREYLYWLLPLALLPLAFALGQPPDDPKARFEQTVEALPPEERARVRAIEQSPGSTLDDVLGALPQKRILGAFLPRDTAAHWLFAAAAVIAGLALTGAAFTGGKAESTALLGVGLFTATAGVVVLLAVQGIVAITYHDALDNNNDFAISLFGYILGVGLFEELAKAVPLLWRYRYYGPLRWRAAVLWGLASGAGFGVAEGIFYAVRFYNGVSAAETYGVRFASCVGLHAIWSASVALSLSRRPGPLTDVKDRGVYAVALLGIVAVPAVLHGLYDALLQYDQNAGALAVAVVSFGWLAVQIERTRHLTAPPIAEPAAAPAV